MTREFALTPERSVRLKQMADARRASENEVVERALDLYFNLADFFDGDTERQDWYRLSEAALNRVWDNEQDAAYDDWRVLYGVPQG
ncbi:MAG: hypothetical protein KJZ86_22695 [Caldilineaceae bacterium]|nr:hypothetical protein [Caldilineaceae bacterium]HRJ45419.1 hypothetical protein [Caldilineaceae bacterium]